MNPFNIAIRIRQAVWGLFFVVMALWLLNSCEQKELCYDHNHASNVMVTFNWEKAPEANPSSMFFYLIPRESGGNPLIREFPGKEGGEAKAPVGKSYRSLGFNSDTKNLQYSYISTEGTLEAHNKDASALENIDFSTNLLPRAEGTENEKIVVEADSLYAGTSEKDILVTLEDNDRGVAYDVEVTPKQMFCTYKIIIKNIEHVENVTTSIAGSLSGIAGGINLVTGEKTTDDVIVSFPLSIKENTSLEGQIKCFGRSLTESIANKFIIYAILQDGTKWCYKYDVTQQIEEAPDPKNVEIVLDKLPIPKEIKGNSGITPGVSDWTIVDVPINM